MTNEIVGHILAIGKRGRHELTLANACMEKYLQGRSDHGRRGYSSQWKNSATEYFTHLTSVPDMNTDNLLYTVYDHPVEFSKEFRLEKDRFNGMVKQIARVEGSLPIVLSSTKESWGGTVTCEREDISARKVYNEAKGVYDLMRNEANRIVPGRELVLLLDNGHHFFKPPEFLRFLRKEKTCPGHAVTGSMCKKH